MCAVLRLFVYFMASAHMLFHELIGSLSRQQLKDPCVCKHARTCNFVGSCCWPELDTIAQRASRHIADTDIAAQKQQNLIRFHVSVSAPICLAHFNHTCVHWLSRNCVPAFLQFGFGYFASAAWTATASTVRAASNACS